jgi:Fe-S-cluster containining protein
VSGQTWYRDGLRFECTGCGRCCTGGDGYVWMSEDEIVALAAHLDTDVNDFGRRFLRRFENRYALIDGPGGACVFLDGRTCSIYDVRPAQCRAFPWWPANLRSPEAWKKAAAACEGISEVAPVVVADVIEASLTAARDAGLRQGFADDDAPDAGERER